ncbi:NAD(P)-dependent oxidoreductase [Arcticibacterium luteifluviistationis]|uniref:Saccharopine dehydrogenase [NAD(+), L-lysine-forming] n=1 Tax=Arcticibacterium luteifluviistationis TaxID=1784714 RepID=A0A2Z4GDZ1_9BACT|nr:NAD(P)-dependent oxidoreductase [Arcticibacterium luteifluviistationis]AWV99502.1 alanine dehydrogenase [Arcticibacterium luteifluviistationis]
MKIGIIREEKNPTDSRVTLSPAHCKQLIEMGLDVVVQPSKVRCFSDDDYLKAGIPMQEDLSDRTVLIGVKEVPIEALIPNKTYFFFSHTFKAQPYNQKLLKAIVDKNITLMDYEVLTNDSGARVIAFGKFAGMVGAHNALWTYGKRTGAFELPRMTNLFDYKAAKEVYKKTAFPNIKVVLTGTGRVAKGAAQVLNDMRFTKVRPIDYVKKAHDKPVYTQLNSFYYAKRKDGEVFDEVQDFYKNPTDYDSDFEHFLPMSDIMINGIYWDNDAPAFFTIEQMASPDFNIKVIADVTCDIAPTSSIPSTLRPTTIADPVFGFDPVSKLEVASFQENAIDMMTIDNLPNELPRDASEAFGDMFIAYVIPELLKGESDMLTKATIATQKNLGPHFEYLRDYLEGK